MWLYYPLVGVEGGWWRSFGSGLLLLGILAILDAEASVRVPSPSICLFLDPVTGAGVSSLSSIGALPMASKGARGDGWKVCVWLSFSCYLCWWTLCWSVTVLRWCFAAVPLSAFHFLIHWFSSCVWAPFQREPPLAFRLLELHLWIHTFSPHFFEALSLVRLIRWCRNGIFPVRRSSLPVQSDSQGFSRFLWWICLLCLLCLLLRFQCVLASRLVLFLDVSQCFLSRVRNCVKQ